MFWPFGDAKGEHKLGFERQIGGDAQARLGVQILHKVLKESHIAVGRFDKKLCLVLGLRTLLVVADGADAFGLFDRQIAVEAKFWPLSPEAIIARFIDDGPDIGTSRMPFR